MSDLIKCKALKEFSSTMFGNIETGQILHLTSERVQTWVDQGLIKVDQPVEKMSKENDVSKMTKPQLVAFAKEEFGVDLKIADKADKLRADIQALVDRGGKIHTDVDEMDVEELVAFAKKTFDIDLDSESPVEAMRIDVNALLECI